MLISFKTPSEKHPESCLTSSLGTTSWLDWHVKWPSHPHLPNSSHTDFLPVSVLRFFVDIIPSAWNVLLHFSPGWHLFIIHSSTYSFHLYGKEKSEEPNLYAQPHGKDSVSSNMWGGEHHIGHLRTSSRPGETSVQPALSLVQTRVGCHPTVVVKVKKFS